MNRIGIDVGGTFTDIVLVDDGSGKIWSLKYLLRQQIASWEP